MITSNVAYAALAYLPINPRSQASLQRALVAKSAATIVATIQSNPSEQRKHKNYFLAQNLAHVDKFVVLSTTSPMDGDPFEGTFALLCKRQSFNRSNFHVQAQMNYFV